MGILWCCFSLGLLVKFLGLFEFFFSLWNMILLDVLSFGLFMVGLEGCFGLVNLILGVVWEGGVKGFGFGLLRLSESFGRLLILWLEEEDRERCEEEVIFDFFSNNGVVLVGDEEDLDLWWRNCFNDDEEEEDLCVFLRFKSFFYLVV